MEAPAKIIVVDDEKRICHNVAKILSKNKYEVTHAVSAQEALEKMAKESFSLLISDIVMPGQNGLELLKMVKKEWPLTKAVMMTAYAATETAVKAIRLGALDYIETNSTKAEHGNRATGFYLGVKGYRAYACGNAAADITNFIEWGVRTNLGDGNFREHRVIGESGTAHVMKDWFAIQ